jgi:hypothetical protein
MDTRALFRISAGQEYTFDSHIVEQPWTIRVFGNTPTWPNYPIHKTNIGESLLRIECFLKGILSMPFLARLWF